jgi:hypothetical protein
MRRCRIIMTLACAAAAGCTAPPAVTHTAQARAGGAVWGRAIEVPGLGRLNAGGEAQVISVSCASAGNCAAGGFYRDRSRHSQAWVASQVNGRWGTAIEVPGTAALNADGEAQVSSVSCSSAGNCMAGGSYKSLHGRFQAWVASQVNGRWGTAIVVPGTAALNAGGDGGVTSVSCVSAGTCTAGGFYTDGSGLGNFQGFVASQVNGRWGTVIEVPGSATLNAGGNAGVNSVACASAGNCTVGGYYAAGSGPSGHWHFQAFVASQRNGSWGTAIEVPGTAALDAAGIAGVTSVACASAGNCAAAGFYHGGSSIYSLAFVASQRNGRWGTAIEVPGTAALNPVGDTRVSSVACAPAGNCTAGGSYEGRHGSFRAFVASQRNGRWDMATLNAGGFAAVRSVSCASPGNCAAGGYYVDGSGHLEAFVAIQRNGRWGTAIEVPGTAALNAGGEAQVNSVSCNRSGPCTAGGFYKRQHGPNQGFVVSWS